MLDDEQDDRLKAQAVPITHIYLVRVSDEKPFASDTHNWNDNQFQKLNDAMVEFLMSRLQTGIEKLLSSTTLKSYVCDVQRALPMEWGYDVNFLGHSFF